MSPTHHILVVDDDPDIRVVLTGVYRRAGFAVSTAADGVGAIRHVYTERPDLIVLDLGLPEMDGLDVLERIREMCDVPVLILTARGHESDKVTALVQGADDYLTKPFSNAELVARTASLLRRSGAPTAAALVVDDGKVRMDLARRLAWVEGAPVTLTPTDWSLLLAFVQHPGEALSADRLLALAWRDPFGIGPDRVKFAVLRLRRRVGWDDPNHSPIESVRGFGYRYVPHGPTPS